MTSGMRRNTHLHDRKIYGLHFVIKSISMCESVKYFLVIRLHLCQLLLLSVPEQRELNAKMKETNSGKSKTERAIQPTTISSLIFHSFIRKHNICLLLTFCYRCRSVIQTSFRFNAKSHIVLVSLFPLFNSTFHFVCVCCNYTCARSLCKANEEHSLLMDNCFVN